CPIPDPGRAKPVAALVDHLQTAANEVQRPGRMRLVVPGEESRGIVERIKEGVAAGEEVAPGYVGRNFAALLDSAYLVTHGYEPDAAWLEVQRWNEEANPVPLGSEPEDGKGELEYVFRRAQRYAAERTGAARLGV